MKLRLKAIAIILIGAGSVATPALSSAQTTTISTNETCSSVTFVDDWLLFGTNSETETLPMVIPAGEVRIPLASSSDSYANREATIGQTSERWGVQFLSGDGTILAESESTEDLLDGTASAQWSGSLPSLTVPAGVEQIVVVHRNGEPAGTSANSVFVSGLTLCWDQVGGTATSTTSIPSSTITTVATSSPATTAAPPAGPVTTLTANPNSPATTIASPGGGLPLTGGETIMVVALGLLLVAGGFVLLMSSRAKSA